MRTYFLMNNSLESIAWTKFSLKIDNNILKQLITRVIIVNSLFELSDMMYNTIVSPCGTSKLYEGVKIIKIGYIKRGKLYFVKSWEVNFPPKELIDELTNTTFIIKIEYLIKGKKRRKLQSDIYKVHISLCRSYINFHIRHVQGLLRTSFEEVFNVFKANFLKNLRSIIHHKLKSSQY